MAEPAAVEPGDGGTGDGGTGGGSQTSPGQVNRATGVTATTATVRVTGHGGNDWYYNFAKRVFAGAMAQAQSEPDTCNGPATGYTETITGLDANSTYVFRAFGDAQCTQPMGSARTVTTSRPGLKATDVTHDSATLTISGWTLGAGDDKDGDWHYKYTTPSGGTCSSAQTEKTAAVTGLTIGAAHVFEAYSDSGCTDLPGWPPPP